MPTQEQLVKAAEAIQTDITNKAYLPMFVKLAQAKGVEINTREDLDAALDICARIESEEQSKPSLLKQAAARLSPQPNQAPDFVKAAAQDPDIRNAVLASLQLNELATK